MGHFLLCQQIESGAADDDVLILVGCEMFAKPVDSGYHRILSSSRSAAMETRSWQ